MNATLHLNPDWKHKWTINSRNTNLKLDQEILKHKFRRWQKKELKINLRWMSPHIFYPWNLELDLNQEPNLYLELNIESEKQVS